MQRPIPIWVGGESRRALERMGRLADGWFPQEAPGPGLDAARAVVEASARAAGRDPASLGMEGRASLKTGGVGELVAQIERWHAAGATHVSVNTMDAGLRSVGEHLAALSEVTAQLPPGSI